MPRAFFTFIILLCAGVAQAQPLTTKPFVPSPGSNHAEPDCGCEIKPADLLALVNGIRISAIEVDKPIRSQLEALRRQVITARQRELDLQINSRLLEAEAKQRGISAQKLIDEVILSQVKAPTEAEAQTFYEQNKTKIQSDFPAVKEELLAYLFSLRQREQAGAYAAQLRKAAAVKIIVLQSSPPKTLAERKQVLATVNGQAITAEEVETSLQPLIYQVQEEMYALRLNELTLRINDTLLQLEAQKQKLTPEALLNAALQSQTMPITEEAALKFYEQNKDRVSGEFAQLKEQIISYLQNIEERKVEQALALRLRQAALVEVFLPAPAAPVLSISTDDQPFKGNPSAPVTIVEFTDFQCLGCTLAQPIIEQILKEYEGKVKLVLRDFPLEKHAAAFKAAEAAEAARAQGKYWEYITLLLQNQASFSAEKFTELAEQLNLDTRQFNSDLAAGKFAAQVQRDLEEGARLGVSGTPTLFVNGRRVSESSYSSLKAAVDLALKEAMKQ